MESRLYNSTVASVSKCSPDPEDKEPKEAFGHPIEPAYRSLVRKSRGSLSPDTSNPRRCSGASRGSTPGSVRKAKGGGNSVSSDVAVSNGHLNGKDSDETLNLDEAKPALSALPNGNGIARSETIEL